MNIYQRIEANQAGLDRLFSKWRIQAKGLDGIREGYNKHGATFMGLVADVLNDHLSNFDGEFDMGPEPFNYDALSEGSPKKSIWDQLNNVLGIAERGGEILWKIKNGTPPATNSNYTPPVPTDNKSTNYLLIGAGLALVIILVLIFKR